MLSYLKLHVHRMLPPGWYQCVVYRSFRAIFLASKSLSGREAARKAPVDRPSGTLICYAPRFGISHPARDIYGKFKIKAIQKYVQVYKKVRVAFYGVYPTHNAD